MFNVVVPVYIGEMSPKESRGMLVSLLSIVSGIGVVIGLCTNIGFSKFLLGWRLTSAVLGLGGLMYALTILWIPHTPRLVTISLAVLDFMLKKSINLNPPIYLRAISRSVFLFECLVSSPIIKYWPDGTIFDLVMKNFFFSIALSNLCSTPLCFFI